MAQADSRMLQEELPRCSAKLGVHLDQSPLIKTITLAQLRYAFEEFRKKSVCLIFRFLFVQGIELAVIILYDSRSYSTIKRLGDLELGMKTQCVKNTTLRKPNVMINLMLKINGKLGGINWSVKQLHEDSLLMVMGADVTHPAMTKADRLQKSVAAVIGSLSPDLMRYAAVIRQQDTRERADKATRELIDSMDTIVTDLLKASLCTGTAVQISSSTPRSCIKGLYCAGYKDCHRDLPDCELTRMNKAFGQFNNNRLPNRIIFYRDGVSEGQFQSTLVSELTAIQRACRLLKQDYEPGITFIVVQKRHHLRFQPVDPRMRNVEPGTVVDQQVTHPREFDFYLCSQEGIQGTTKPAHYHVLYDDNNWSSDALQCFTYYLCHAYMRCCRSVSYPAPTFYSHLAAFRARDWLKDTPRPEEILQNNKFKLNPSQQNAMFFL
ncbi:unnamed protein product [Schistocephalus solidus]|uniref:Piwi domain-containing protein n=1 Tax=Schistocephalus solidus TaxID=70667 RepID=A0A3P7F7W1_SCHSO|nr:unnamed protein product [Schistocephalus solidus]